MRLVLVALLALAALVGTNGQSAAGDNWARDAVRQREAAVFGRAVGVPTERLKALIATPRIVGGIQAGPGKWPFQVGLLLAARPNNFDAQFCGGSIIDEEFILSAAHCAVEVTASELNILTGTQSLTNGGVRRPVRRIAVHGGFNPMTFDYDVALVQLQTKITDFREGHLSLVITKKQESALAPDGTQSTVIGWGDTTGNDTFPTALRQVAIPIVSRAVCNSAKSYAGAITDRMICAGKAQGGKDSCQGDSGGPLVVRTRSGHWRIQTGIVSWGNGCAEPNFYGVYSRLAVLGDWVNAKMNALRKSSATALACEIAGHNPSAPACRRAAKDEADQEIVSFLDVIKTKGTPSQAQSATAEQRAWAQSQNGVCAFEAALDRNQRRDDCLAKNARARANVLAKQLSQIGD